MLYQAYLIDEMNDPKDRTIGVQCKKKNWNKITHSCKEEHWEPMSKCPNLSDHLDKHLPCLTTRLAKGMDGRCEAFCKISILKFLLTQSRVCQVPIMNLFLHHEKIADKCFVAPQRD